MQRSVPADDGLQLGRFGRGLRAPALAAASVSGLLKKFVAGWRSRRKRLVLELQRAALAAAVGAPPGAGSTAMVAPSRCLTTSPEAEQP